MMSVLNNAPTLQCLDELHVITRRLCGGVPIRGFEKWILRHKSRGTAQTTVSRTDTVAEREPLIIASEKSGREVV